MKTMNAQRLKALAEAYGSDLRRWPDVERGSAQLLLARQPELAEIIARAGELDVLLAASRPVQPSAALYERVVASAMATGPKVRGVGRFWLNRLVLASGAGWAAAACAGVVFGMGLTSHLTADAQADAVLYQASLATFDDTEVLG